MIRIGMDIDGVLYDWGNTARFLLEHYWGIPYAPPDGFDAIKEHAPKEAWDWLWDTGVFFGLFRHGNLFKGAVEGCVGLSQYGRMVYITKRPRTAQVDTIRWLAHHEFPVDELHILSQGKKSEVRPHADVYIDDSPEVMTDLSANVPKARLLLWDRPWNQDVREQRWLKRVSSWREVEEEVGWIAARAGTRSDEELRGARA